MGTLFSFPFAEYDDVENGIETIIVNSISLGQDDIKTPIRSVSFSGRDLEPTIMASLGSGKMTLEASVSLKGEELDKLLSIKSSFSEEEDIKKIPISSTGIDSPVARRIPEFPVLDPMNPKHAAAVKLQKVYKSFRTRRKLADCAVLVEQSWWKLLDFAELKRSSISFFDMEKHETAVSRWSRARTRAAKVGKGLSKNDKAQKLALQHWLEAIDPRHRYGHNLHFYYVKWLHCQSKEPFFYWLDIGEGKEVNIVEKCSRTKLQQQCIKYLGPMERVLYEVVLDNGKFYCKQSGDLLHTVGSDKDAKWIFVLSTSKTLYVGKKKKGTFQHSSFLAGGATSAAGRLVIENGILKAVWPHSGHYRPTEENFRDFISFLEENNVELTHVKMSPVDEEDNLPNKQKSSLHLRINSTDEDLIQNITTQECSFEKSEATLLIEPSEAKKLRSLLSRKLTNLAIPSKDELIEQLEDENKEKDLKSSEDGSEPDYLAVKQNLFEEGSGGQDDEAEAVPEESILKRINSHKGMKSYQLGKQLSCKWTTGVGPRIGCVKDYPSELRVFALEQVSLSPRSSARSRSYFSPRASGRGEIMGLFDESNSSCPTSVHHSVQQSSLSRGTSLTANY